MKNRLREIWKRDEAALGGWLAVPNTFTAELMSRLGFDWLTIDMQHGLIDYQAALQMLQAMTASETVSMVRVPWNEPGIIGKVLDAGAEGVIVPMVNTREQSEAAAAACRYPPLGRRSFGPTRAALVGGSDYFDRANDEIICLIMIETQQALDNLDEILDVPGIDGVYVGPNDLSVSLGLPPAPDHEAESFRSAIAAILEGCHQRGLTAGCAGTTKQAPMRIEGGFRFVEVSRDAGSMARAAREDLRAIRKVPGASGG